MFAKKDTKPVAFSSSLKTKESNTPFFQPKPEVGTPGDQLEVEAENVAAQVVEKTSEQNTFLSSSSFFNPAQTAVVQNSPSDEVPIGEEIGEEFLEGQLSPDSLFDSGNGNNVPVQGKCAECEEEEKLQTSLEDDSGEAFPVQQSAPGDLINRYPDVDCEDGQVLGRAQTVVWFQHDSTDFRNDSEVDSNIHFMFLLREVQNYLGMTGIDGLITIHGYASEEGGPAHNLTLSMQRALRIRSLLAAFGIPEAQMIPIGHGENTEYETLEYNRRVEVTYYPTVTCMEFDPLPVTGSVTVMDCSDGRNINNNGDHDLDKLIHSPDDRSPDIWVYDNLLGEFGAYSDFYIGFFTGTFGVDTTDDNRLFDNFTTGSGGQIDFSTGSDMAREIGGTDAFTEFADAFEESVRNYFYEHDTLHGFDCQAELIRTRPDYVGGTDSLFSWAVMGGYQRLEAHIDLSGGDMDIIYRVFDHYGAGVSDAWSYLPGLSAMYYLQHYVTGSSSTYVPFIWSVNISRINTL